MDRNSWHLMWVGRIMPSPQWRMKSHRHEFSELVVVVDGTLHVKEPGGNSRMGKTGSVFIYPAGCRHEEESDRDDPVETIYFSFKGGAGEKIRSVDDRDGRIRVLSQWIWSSRQDTYPHSQRMNRVFFEATREEFMRLEHPPAMKTAFAAVRGYVHENIGHKITLDELAAQANMSKFHFLREYKKETGQSPMAYVRGVRIEEARNLIGSTNLPLKAVADMVGFSNEYQLSSVTKKYSGHPPSFFRRQRT